MRYDGSPAKIAIPEIPKKLVVGDTLVLVLIKLYCPDIGDKVSGTAVKPATQFEFEGIQLLMNAKESMGNPGLTGNKNG